MAIYHLRLTNGKAGRGLAHYEYITASGKYKYKQDELAYCLNNLPKNMTNEFWSESDFNERMNGRAYKEIRVALPCELNLEDNKQLLNKFLEKELGNKYFYTAVIHNKENINATKQNIHAHIMICPRVRDGISRSISTFFKRYNPRYPERGGAKKDEYWNERSTLLHLRKSWENILNEKLIEKGIEKVSCKSLKEQREEALKAGNFELAEKLDRHPINISSSYILKKDIKDLTENQKLILEDFKISNRIKKLLSDIDKLVELRDKELEAEEKHINKVKELNIDIANIEKQITKDNNEFKDVYSLSEDILILQVEKEFIKNKLMPNNTNENENNSLQQTLDSLIIEIEKKNNLLLIELNKYKENNYFSNVYSKLNQFTLKQDFLKSLKYKSKVSVLWQEIDNHKRHLLYSRDSILNVLSKKEYAKVKNKYNKVKHDIDIKANRSYIDSKDPLYIEMEKLENQLKAIEKKYTTGKNKHKFEIMKYKLEKKYKDIITTKELELEKSKILLNMLEDKIDFKNQDKLYKDIIKEINMRYQALNKKINKCELKIKDLENQNVEFMAYNKLSKGKYKFLLDNYKSNNEAIKNIENKLNNLSIFNLNQKIKLSAELKELQSIKVDLGVKIDEIKSSITNEDLNKLKSDIEIKINNEIEKLTKNIKIYQKNQLGSKAMRDEANKLYSSGLRYTKSLSLNNFVNNHNKNVGIVLNSGSNINLNGNIWRDKLDEQIRREMDFSRA